MKMKKSLPLALFALMFTGQSSANLNGVDYRSWFAELTLPSEIPQSVDGRLFYPLEGKVIDKGEIKVLTDYNVKIAGKYLRDFSERDFSDALNNLLYLAENGNYSPASYAYSTLLRARNREFCKVSDTCSRKLTKKMKEHYTIAANADETGGAAFQFALVLGKERHSGWRDNMIHWNAIGKSKKTSFLADEINGKY